MLSFKKKISYKRETKYTIIQNQLLKLDDRLELVFCENDVILPYVHCSICKNHWYLYKVDGGTIKANSIANIQRHLNSCKSQNSNLIQTPIVHHAISQMPNDFRSHLTETIARFIAKSPTLSINAATKFANNLLNEMSPKILRQGKNFEYNTSRQIVSEKIKDIGISRKHLNRKKLNENLSSSSIVFDHWSSHGKNFFCAIAHTVNDQFDREHYCVSLKQACADK